MTEQQPILLLHREVILLHINHVQIPDFSFILTHSFNRILHQHLSVYFIHDHNSRVMHFIFLRSQLLPQQVIIHSVLVISYIVVHMLSQFIEQKHKLLFFNSPLQHHRLLIWLVVFLVLTALFSRQFKKLVEVLQSDLVIDETPVDDKLHELRQAHCVGLGFGESSPQLVKFRFIILLQDHWIVTVFRHSLQARSFLFIII